MSLHSKLSSLNKKELKAFQRTLKKLCQEIQDLIDKQSISNAMLLPNFNDQSEDFTQGQKPKLVVSVLRLRVERSPDYLFEYDELFKQSDSHS